MAGPTFTSSFLFNIPNFRFYGLKFIFGLNLFASSRIMVLRLNFPMLLWRDGVIRFVRFNLFTLELIRLLIPLIVYQVLAEYHLPPGIKYYCVIKPRHRRTAPPFIIDAPAIFNGDDFMILFESNCYGRTGCVLLNKQSFWHV